MLDINLNEDLDLTDIEDELTIYIQEIMMILNSQPQEIMGCYNMSIDLERLIYDTNIDNNTLKKEIETKIMQYTTLYDRFPTSVYIRFAKGVSRDICIIDIIINSQKIMSLIMK